MLYAMKPLRQPNRAIVTYTPRVEPAPPEHAWPVDGFRDVYLLKGNFVAFVLVGNSFQRSPVFTLPESAQRWANQVRQEHDV